MGHQITFHMLDEDRREFFRFLSSKHRFVASGWTSDTSAVVHCESPAQENGALALWEPSSRIQRQRKKIVREDGSIVYEFDRQLSVLEFDPSVFVMHGRSPALLQGRLYSFLSEMGIETSSLFRAARQWIKRSFEHCPLELLGGYIGPVAMRWYRDGGILLPMFNPPATPAWEEFITSQHPPQNVS
jgi:hypothetical protein